MTALLVPVQFGGQASAEGGVPGTLDPTFNTDGIAINELMSNLSSVDAAARLSDGRILVLADGLVWRFFADGSVDTGFDADGVLTPALPTDFRFPNMLAPRPGGGFVLSRTSQFDSSCDGGRVAAYDANGAPVTGFGTNGVACINFPNFSGSRIADVVVQDDGQVVVLGTYQTASGAAQIALARLDTTGATVDTVVQPLTSTFEGGDDLVVQPDGKIVVAGNTNTSPNFTTIGVVLSRYDGATLTRDTTFGDGDGIVTASSSLDAAGQPVKVAIAADGADVVEISAVVAGRTDGNVPQLEQHIVDETGSPNDSSPNHVDLTGHSFVTMTDLTATATGYLAIGEIEDSPAPFTNSIVAVSFARGFGDAEPAYVAFPGGNLQPGGSVLLPDGKLLHAGRLEGPGGEQLVFTRLVEDPTADPRTVTLDPTIGSSFGRPGFLSHNAIVTDRGEAVAVQTDGQVLVGGRTRTASSGPGTEVGGQGFVLRHRENGSLDTTFGGPPPGVAFLDFEVYGVATLPDGRMLAAGSQFFFPGEGPPSRVAAAQRLLANGRPDPTWNDGQPITVSPGSSNEPEAHFRDVAVQPDGKVVAVGDYHVVESCGSDGCTSQNWIFVARFDQDGGLDLDFGDDGFALIGPVAGSGSDEATQFALAQGRGIVLQPDGQIVVTGGLGGQLMVARLQTGGTPDPTFAAPAGPFGPGVLVDDLLPGDDSERGLGRDVALRPDGRIDVAGDLIVVDCSAGVACFTRNIAIAVQYLPAGTRDGVFGDGGLAVIAPTASEGHGVAIDGAGNVLVGGTASTPATGTDVLLARLLPTGARDPGFGTSGLVLTDVEQNDAGNGLAIAPDGRIVVAGLNNNTRGDRVLTARYEPGAALRCAPSPLEFGGVVLATGAETQAVTCTNTGPSRLTITAVTSSGTNAAEFVPSAAGCQVTLVPGQSCQIPVAFTPTGVGARTAALGVVHSGQGAAGPISVGLTGTGIANDTTLTFNPAPLVFAERLGLTTSPAQAVTVRNTGTVPVTINGVSIENDPAGDFAISASTCTGATLPPGGTCQVSVTFTPKAPGGRTATLRFDDTGVGTPHRPALTGTGSTPTLSLNPGLGQPGSVTAATGAKFPPNQSVTLAWVDPLTLVGGGFAEPVSTVITGADGALTANVLAFPKSRIGSRALLATVGGFGANAAFLVTPGTLQGPDLIYRR